MARKIAILLTAAAVAAMLPTAATARPGFRRTPGFHVLQLSTRGTHGYLISVIVMEREAILNASRYGSGGDSSVVYLRRLPPPHGGDLSFDLGRAGHIHANFAPSKVEKSDPAKYCVGGPTVVETGTLVGSFTFHGRDGFTNFHAHRLHATATREPPRICRRAKEPRRVTHDLHAARRSATKIRRLVAGEPSGDIDFSATSYPSPWEELETTFSAGIRRREDGLAIIDSAESSPTTSTFTVPRLDRLPATATVELPAPFAGSATFDLPSRRTATLSGDLRVDLPEAGEVALTGPGIHAGVCLGYTCTKSLPKALRPQRPKYGIGEAEIQTIR